MLLARTVLRGQPHAEIEDLFGRLDFIAPALAATGVLILVSAIFGGRRSAAPPSAANDLSAARAGVIGAVQGLCLPFRGLSRSGATISTGMLLGVARVRAESFSFALAGVLTPAAMAREALRLVHAVHAGGGGGLGAAALGSVLGAAVAFVAGLLALRWLSRWLEGGRWYLFGIYCLVAAAAVLWLHRAGY
jgi:undecaprenyl-diphosphatase